MAKWKPEYFESKVKPNGNLGQKRFIANSIDNKKVNVVKNNNLKTTKHSHKNSTYQTNGKDTLVSYGEFHEYIKKAYFKTNESSKLLKFILKKNGIRNTSITRSNLVEIEIFNDYKENSSLYHQMFRDRNNLSELLKDRPNMYRVSWHFEFHPIRSVIILVVIFILIYYFLK